ncbi:hypothetical protein GWI33_000931 [Rhynchophorus ferrugineus]|uniref:Uncharacterized protein n=1 Tax=Rhynchophorus ferrugineus TaxID=354439 RepID=A0A834HM94_RHYFE|nr:hypothetical protein GWI33_000931 [Rhynchophorus ferrugineus]
MAGQQARPKSSASSKSTKSSKNAAKMSDQQKDEHIRHLEAQIAILQNQVAQLINTKMTTGETDNDVIDFGKLNTDASTDSEGEFQPVRRKKKGQRRLKSTTTTDEESNQSNRIKQQAKRQAVDQNRDESAFNALCISNIAIVSTSSSAPPQTNVQRISKPMDHATTSNNEQTPTTQSNDILAPTSASTKKSRVPPIILRDKNAYSELIRILTFHGIQFGSTQTKPEGVALFPPTPDDYRMIINVLNDRKYG